MNKMAVMGSFGAVGGSIAASAITYAATATHNDGVQHLMELGVDKQNQIVHLQSKEGMLEELLAKYSKEKFSVDIVITNDNKYFCSLVSGGKENSEYEQCPDSVDELAAKEFTQGTPPVS